MQGVSGCAKEGGPQVCESLGNFLRAYQASLPTCLMSTTTMQVFMAGFHTPAGGVNTLHLSPCFGSVWGPPFVWGLLDVSTSGCRLSHIIYPLEKIPTGVSSFHSQTSVTVTRPGCYSWLH